MCRDSPEGSYYQCGALDFMSLRGLNSAERAVLLVGAPTALD